MKNNNEEIKMDEIKWFHSIDIIGVVTPGGANNEVHKNTFNELNLPNDISNLTVLDIGAWDGFFSFECEKRGAKRVVASDYFAWNHVGTKDAGFNFAHSKLNSKVEKLVSSVEELDYTKIGKFDIVLMLGVIYHAKNPIQYLEIAKSLCSGTVYIETHVDMLDINYPAAKYYVGDELNNDPTNYWGFNPAAVIGMMKDIGYKNITESELQPNIYRVGDYSRWIFRGNI